MKKIILALILIILSSCSATNTKVETPVESKTEERQEKPLKEIVEMRTPFSVNYKLDNTLEKGKKKILKEGEKGIVEIEKITNKDGKTISRKKLKTIKEAINKVILIGSKEEKKVKKEEMKLTAKEETTKKEEVSLAQNKTIEKATQETHEEPAPQETYKAPAPQKPKEEKTYKDIVDEEVIAFETEYVDDPDSQKGVERVIREGQNGIKRTVTRIYYTNNKETGREVIESTNTQAVNKKIGTGSFEPYYTDTGADGMVFRTMDEADAWARKVMRDETTSWGKKFASNGSGRWSTQQIWRIIDSAGNGDDQKHYIVVFFFE